MEQEQVKVEEKDINKLIFMLVEIDHSDPRRFMPVCYGVVFDVKQVDDNVLDVHWMCFRQIEVTTQDGRRATMIQSPPPAFKWRMDKDHYRGSSAFSMDNYMGPGHLYRIIWVILPDASKQLVAPSEHVSTIISSPKPSIIIPGMMSQ